MRNPLKGFAQGAVTYQQVGHKVYEQQLPSGQVQAVLYEYAGYEQDSSNSYEQKAAVRASFFMMMLVFAMLAMMIVMLVLMMLLVLAMMIVMM